MRSQLPDRPSGDIRRLREIVPYLKPYGWGIIGAAVALTFAAGAVLVMGIGLRALIDEGFQAFNAGRLSEAPLGVFRWPLSQVFRGLLLNPEMLAR